MEIELVLATQLKSVETKMELHPDLVLMDMEFVA